MTRAWRSDQPVVVHTVVRDRSRSHSLEAMSGPEFTGVGSVYGWLAWLSPAQAVIAIAALVLVGVAGCTAAWVDYSHYEPSPNICRVDQLGSVAQQSGSCVSATQVPGVSGHVR
ncbi:hypothetical protein [Nocardia brasiliensis]|uniref:hypothetical protein n=1 Tax=Nocardia brasiliensis TaxID=37326 RepID=UPI0024575B4D|nr:hypothetical protein [Nocardia brasiliensis]